MSSHSSRSDVRKSFNTIKSKEEIKKTLLINVVKMLTARKILNKGDIDKNIGNILNGYLSKHIFEIKNTNSGKYYITIIDYNLTSISKLSNISSFVKSTTGSSRIVIAETINPKISTYLFNNYNKTESFSKNELMINLIDHELQPKFELLDKKKAEEILDNYFIKKENLPVMLYSDPIRKYFNAKIGDVFRIDGGFQVRYRVVKRNN